MPAITITDLNNAKIDVDDWAEFMTSASPTYTDRLGNVRPTLLALQAEFPNASINAAAAASAATATVEEVIATAQVALAVAARTAAEAARDASFITGPKYATEALGRAAVADGANFFVQGAGEVAAYEYRRTNSTTSVLIAAYPSTLLTSQLMNTAPAGYAWALLDQNGLAAAGVLADGTFRVKSVLADDFSSALVTTSELDLGSDAMTVNVPGGYVWAPVDQNGLSPGGFKTDGTFAVAAVETAMLNGEPTALLPKHANTGNFASEIVHILSYGQSLSLGHIGTPIQTVSQLYDSLMFTGGVRVQQGAGSIAANHAAFIPLVEVLNATTGDGETPIGNMFATVKRLIAVENSLAYTGQTYKLLGSAPGLTNTAIAGLAKGQPPYTSLMADVTYGVANAAAAGLTYTVPAVCWSQGERDYTLGTAYATYLAALLQLYIDLNTDIKAATGQARDIKLICYQSNNLPGTSPATVALAQLQASKTNPSIILACPTYNLEHATGNVHLTGTGSVMLGARYALAYKRTEIDGGTWLPLRPISTWRQGPIVLAKFNVPSLPLVFDTTLFPAVANMGFTLVDNTGAAIVINSVSIVEPDTVKVIAAAPIPATSKLRYGYAYGGNLRDSQGATMQALLFVPLPLHNWCVAFEETIV